MEPIIQGALIEVLQESVDLQRFSNLNKANFEEDMKMDSLDLVELIVALEQKLEITIEEKHLVGVRTVEDLVKAIGAIMQHPSTSNQNHVSAIVDSKL